MCTAETGGRIRGVPASWIGCAGLIVAALLCDTCPAPARPATTADTYISVRGATPLTIAHDRVQILRSSGASIAGFWQFVNSQGLVLQDSLVDRHFVFTFSPPETLERRELVARARQLKQDGSNFISDVGLSVTRGGGTVPMIATDMFIARFGNGVRGAAIDTLNLRYGVRVVERNRYRPSQYLLTLTSRSPDTLDVIEVANRYHAESTLVAYAHPNFVRVIRFQQYKPNDLEFPHQWHHDTDASPAATDDADIDTPHAWSLMRNLTNPGETVIAVIDGGFDLAHTDLKDVLWTNTGETGLDSQGKPKETNGDDDDGNGVKDDVHGFDVYDCDDNAERSNRDRLDCGDGDPSYVVVGVPSGSTTLMTVDRFDSHGTMVAGLAAAEVDNDFGTAGVSMGAKLMPIRRGLTEYALVKAVDYARVHGADVINCSWAEYTPESDPASRSMDEALREAVEPSSGRGAVVVFSMDYAASATDCGNFAPTYDLASNPSVLAVGAVSDLEQRLVYTGCGDYLDVLAPSDWGDVAGQGTLNVATTDVSTCDGTICHGYNSEISVPNCSGNASDDDYTYCFTGTSAAAPIAAGVAGLILTADPTVEPEAVRRLMQDTADRVEPTLAKYESTTGFSRPGSTPSTHGYGRVNAYEAVRIAAPAEADGKGGIDIFVRDNVYDWGNTEQPSNTLFEPAEGKTRGYEPHWRSEDIKVDAPPYQIPSATSPGDADQEIDSKQFDSLMDEDPLPGERNAVYFRVRNRGYNDAGGVKTRLYWTRVTTVLPRLPDDFWTGFATNSFTSGDWTFLGQRPVAGSAPVTLANSGSTVARESRDSTTGVDPAAVHYFEWTGPDLTPDVKNHFCLLGIADSDTDHPEAYQRVLDFTPPDPVSESELFQPDHLTPTDNNVTHRNYWIEDTTTQTSFQVAFYLRNSTRAPRKYRIRYDKPKGWEVQRQGSYPPTSDFVVDPRRPPRLVRFVITAPRRGMTGEVRFDQLLVEPGKKGDIRKQPTAPRKGALVLEDSRSRPKAETTRLAGGVTIGFRPRHAGTR